MLPITTNGITIDLMQMTADTARGRALLLSYATIGANSLEGVVSIGFALMMGSSALLGFGIDSFVESLSATVIIWRFWRTSADIHDERRERTAIRLVGISLFALAAYVVYEAATSLYYQAAPERSIVGLIIAALSLFIMPILYVLKRRMAVALRSRSLETDAKQTLACIFLSVALLVGTGLHFTIGLWQADPLAGMVIAAFLGRAAYEAWREQELCC